MAIVRWTPFDNLAAWERDMQTMLDRFLGRDWFNGERFGWRPRVDMFRRGGELIVRVELPGIDPEKDVDLELDGDLGLHRGLPSQAAANFSAFFTTSSMPPAM